MSYTPYEDEERGIAVDDNCTTLEKRLKQVISNVQHRQALTDLLIDNLPAFRLFAKYLLNLGIRAQLIDHLYQYWTNADTLVNELVELIAPIATAEEKEALELIILHSAGIDLLVYHAEELEHLFPNRVLPPEEATDAAEDLLHFRLNSATSEQVMLDLLNHTIG